MELRVNLTDEQMKEVARNMTLVDILDIVTQKCMVGGYQDLGLRVNEMRKELLIEQKKDEKQETCKHTSKRKEYIMGQQSGDFICNDCGKTAWGRDW